MGRFPGFQPIIPGLTPEQWASPVHSFLEARRQRDLMALEERKRAQEDERLRIEAKRREDEHKAAMAKEAREATEFQQKQAERLRAEEAAATEKIHSNLDPAGKNQPALGTALAQQRGYTVTPNTPQPTQVPTIMGDPQLRSVIGLPPEHEGGTRTPTAEEVEARAQGRPLPVPRIRPRQAPEQDPLEKALGLTPAIVGDYNLVGDRDAALAEQAAAQGDPRYVSGARDYLARRDAVRTKVGAPKDASTADLQRLAGEHDARATAAFNAAPSYTLERHVKDPSQRYGVRTEQMRVDPGQSEAGRQAISLKLATQLRTVANEVPPHMRDEVLSAAALTEKLQLPPEKARQQLNLYLQLRNKVEVAEKRPHGSPVGWANLAFRQDESKKNRTRTDLDAMLKNHGLDKANDTFNLIGGIRKNLLSDNTIQQKAGMMSLYQLRVPDPRISESDYKYGIVEVAGKLNAVEAAVNEWTKSGRMPEGTREMALGAVDELEGRIRQRHKLARETVARDISSKPEFYDPNYASALEGQRLPGEPTPPPASAEPPKGKKKRRIGEPPRNLGAPKFEEL